MSKTKKQDAREVEEGGGYGHDGGAEEKQDATDVEEGGGYEIVGGCELFQCAGIVTNTSTKHNRFFLASAETWRKEDSTIPLNRGAKVNKAHIDNKWTSPNYFIGSVSSRKHAYTSRGLNHVSHLMNI